MKEAYAEWREVSGLTSEQIKTGIATGARMEYDRRLFTAAYQQLLQSGNSNPAKHEILATMRELGRVEGLGEEDWKKAVQTAKRGRAVWLPASERVELMARLDAEKIPPALNLDLVFN